MFRVSAVLWVWMVLLGRCALRVVVSELAIRGGEGALLVHTSIKIAAFDWHFQCVSCLCTSLGFDQVLDSHKFQGTDAGPGEKPWQNSAEVRYLLTYRAGDPVHTDKQSSEVVQGAAHPHPCAQWSDPSSY